jgi:hypothetical protein
LRRCAGSGPERSAGVAIGRGLAAIATQNAQCSLRIRSMDADFLINVAHALTIAGAIVLLAGLITMARPIAAIGLGNRTRAGLVMVAGLCIAFGGVALLNHICDPTIPCNRCSANRVPLITHAHACLNPLQHIAR